MQKLLTAFRDECGYAPKRGWYPDQQHGRSMPLPVTSKEKLQCPLQFIARLFERHARTVCAEGSGWSMAVKSRGVQVPGSYKHVPSRAIRVTCYRFFLPLFLVFVEFIPRVLRSSAPRTFWRTLLIVFTQLTFPPVQVQTHKEWDRTQKWCWIIHQPLSACQKLTPSSIWDKALKRFIVDPRFFFWLKKLQNQIVIESMK